jgi:hypothetical protein
MAIVHSDSERVSRAGARADLLRESIPIEGR